MSLKHTLALSERPEPWAETVDYNTTESVWGVMGSRVSWEGFLEVTFVFVLSPESEKTG